MIAPLLLTLIVTGMIVGLVGLVACTVLLVRNDRVYAWRIRMIDAISAENQRRITTGDLPYPNDLYDRYEAISYDQQVLRFWRPLDSWLDPVLQALVQRGR